MPTAALSAAAGMAWQPQQCQRASHLELVASAACAAGPAAPRRGRLALPGRRELRGALLIVSALLLTAVSPGFLVPTAPGAGAPRPLARPAAPPLREAPPLAGASAAGPVGVGPVSVSQTAAGVAAEVPATVRRAGHGLLGFLPQGCEDDFECNDGKANFPLQCCEVPLLGSFCCEPDNYTPVQQTPAYVPLPVPVEDPWQQRR